MNIVIDILLLPIIGITAYSIGALWAYDKGYKRGIDDMKLARKWEKDNKDREEEKKDPFKIIYRSNTIQFDEMGYPLRLCIVTGNGRINAEQVWLDTLEEDGDVVLEFKKMESEPE